MTFFTILCLMLAWWGVRSLATLIWREGEGIAISKSENKYLEISHRLAQMWGVRRYIWRNCIPIFALKVLSMTLLVLMAMPSPSVLACACTDVVVNGSGGASSSIVDEYDGRFTISQVDLDIPGIAPVQIIRKYNSKNATYGLFGFGWSMDWVICHLENTAGDIEINFGDRMEFFRSADSYRNSDNSLWLTFTGTSEVKVENRNGDGWYFSTIDKTLTKKIDRNGNQTTFTWNVIQKQVAVDSENNPIYQDIYCPNAITYPDGRVLAFSYSTNLGEEYLCTQVASPDGVTTSYGYTQGLLTSVSKATGQTLCYNYHTDTNGYRTIGWLTNITYANAGEVNITYNGEFNTGNALRVTKITGPEGYERDFVYAVEDGQDLNCNKCITTTVTDSLGHSVIYAKSDTGKTRKTTDSLGYYTKNIQDNLYNLTNSINKRGYGTAYGYANANNTDAPVLIRNLRTSMTNALGNASTYQYDANGNKTSVTDPLGHQISYTYDTGRNTTCIKNGLNQTVSTNTYDSLGQLISTKNGSGSETAYAYNAYGYMTNLVDAAGKSWSTTYDTSGRIVSGRDPLGHEMKQGYNAYNKISAVTNALNQVTSFSYDEMANRTHITDANGKENRYGYDKLQRLTSSTNALGNVTRLVYDAEGNLTSLTDALNRITEWTYDAVNRPIRKTYAGGGQESYSYDANGNQVNLTNTAGQSTTWTYDAIDRNTVKTWVGATNTVFSRGYDTADRLTSVSKVAGTTTVSSATLSYNDANQLISTVQDGKTIGYQYDASQRLSRVTYPSSAEARYEYESRSKISAVKDSGGNTVAGYTYDDAGRLTRRTLANGLESVYVYNADNQVTKIALRETSNTNNVRQSFEYGYDNVGNRLYTKYADGTGDVYRYDDAYQVTGVKYRVGNPAAGYDSATNAVRVVTYAYDAAGNRTSMTDNGNSVTYTKNDLNQYTVVGGVSYTFSTRGDITGDSTWTYGYDPEGHLIAANKSGIAVSYSYDALGRRIAKNINGAVTKYVYSGFDLIEERDASDVVTAQYIYEGGIDRPVAVIKGGSILYFQQDALGSVTALTSGAGTVTEKYTYDIYGKPTITDGSGNALATSSTPFLFAGREYDSETGLYHYRARAYSPTLGRFLSRDPIGEKGGLNLYEYVSNNPVNSVDPLGLAKDPKCLKDCADKYPILDSNILDSAAQGAFFGGVAGGVSGALAGGTTGMVFGPGGAVLGGLRGAATGALRGAAWGGIVGGGQQLIWNAMKRAACEEANCREECEK